MSHPWIHRVALLALVALTGGMTGAARAQDVDIAVDQFGVGGRYRPGEFVGVRLLVTARADSALGSATDAWVHCELPNADGDVAEYGRPMTLTKGQARPVWLYAPLPPDAHAGSVWPVRVFDYTDEQRGRELGGMRIRPPSGGRVDPDVDMIGIIGPSQMGLGQYKLLVGGSGVVYTAGEDTLAVFGLAPQDLCDAWEGLRGFSAIAWSGAQPQGLSSAQSDVLREWIRRGGHLVISLPEDANPWGLGEPGKTDLEDLLPTLAPRKDEDVPLSTLLPVLSKQRSLREDADFPLSIRVFADPTTGLDALDNGYEPLIALPDHRVVVVQRLFGHGRITLIGIDLSNARLTRSLPLSNGVLGSLPQGDVFWNRILGRRADTPSVNELREIESQERLTRGTPTEIPVGLGDAFRQEINMSGEAGSGLGLALLLFIVYWVVAGPGGFAVLKHYRLVRHAWVGFAGAAAVFTALAWGGVHALRQPDVTVNHVTFLDHIARPDGTAGPANDPQLQRAASWMSVYLPGYADTMVGIESAGADEGVPAQRDLLSSWTPPRDPGQKFPNADRYVVDVRSDPDDYALPARSTATQLYAHWLGGVDPAWGGLLRSDPADPVRVELDRNGNERLAGSIINELPGDLVDVKIIWVWSRREPLRGYAMQEELEQAWIQPTQSGRMLNVGRMYGETLIGQGETYRLPTASSASSLTLNIFEKYVRRYEGASAATVPGGALSQDDRRRHMEMLSLYQQLTPPKYLKAPDGNNPDTMIARRMLARELDLSAWLTRPCLIVIGYLEASACPIPLRIGGEAVARSRGTTVVRWILPLGLRPEIAFPEWPGSGEDPVADAG